MAEEKVSAGQIGLDLVLNSSGFNKSVNSIQRLASKTGKVLAAAFAVKSITNFTSKCLTLGSNLQEVQNVVDTVFPSMNSQVENFAQNAATQFGLSETMAKKYTGTFGAMADAFGFAEKESHDMATALTGLAGDVASFYNLTQDEAYTKLKSVFTGETETLKDLGVVMTQSALDTYALSNGYGKVTSAMSEQEKVALRYAFVQDQLSNATGDFVRTADSWANQTRVFSLQTETFMSSIGQGLINLLTPALKLLNTLMPKLIAAANAFKEFTAALTGKNVEINSSLGSGIDSVASSADGATSSVNSISGAVKKLKRELAGFDKITKLSDTSVTSAESTNISIGSTSSSTNITTTGAGTSSEVSKLSKAYDKLIASFDKLSPAASKFWGLCKGAGKWAWDNVLVPLGKWTINDLAPTALNLLTAAFEWFSTVATTLKPVWQWLWENLFVKIANFAGNAIIGFLEFFTTNLNNSAEAANHLRTKFSELKTTLSKRIDEIKVKFGVLADGIKGIPEQIASIKNDVSTKWTEVTAGIKSKTVEMKAKVATKWSDLKEKWNSTTINIKAKTADMKAKIATKWSSLKDNWSGITNNIKDKTASMKAKIGTTWKSIKPNWTSITSNISNKTASMNAKIGTTWKSIKSSWTSITSNISNKTASMKAKIGTKWKDLKSSWNSITDNIKDKTVTITAKLKDNITEAIKTMWNGVATGINKAITTINKIPGVNISKLPKLAQGGYVKKNTPQLAMIGDNRHQGEVVAPENKLLEMAKMAAAGAGGNDGEIIILLKEIITLISALSLETKIDSNALTNIIIKLINQKTKSTGQCPIVI